jgi:acyl carrier protein
MDKLPEDANIPVGKPIQNVKIYILDKAGKHCPIGIEGEIYVSGIAVGRGYINDSKKTSESFLTDPFIDGPVRMYKTGDMGRWLQNGTVEFTGRKDDQVKIRGYRIELGEIEHALFSAPGVKDAVVIVKQNNDEKYIVAYVITENGIEAGSLRLYLDKKLPSYMIPAFFIRLDKFPLNSNGKIDKKKLPDPQTTKGENHSYIAPETETQKKLAVIWSDILGKKDIGIKDNFLELGGHSLKAVKVISRIQETFDVKISIASFLAEGDIESQAKYLDTLACLDIDAVPGEELLF